jgi:hypothetical protein
LKNNGPHRADPFKDARPHLAWATVLLLTAAVAAGGCGSDDDVQAHQTVDARLERTELPRGVQLGDPVAVGDVLLASDSDDGWGTTILRSSISARGGRRSSYRVRRQTWPSRS